MKRPSVTPEQERSKQKKWAQRCKRRAARTERQLGEIERKERREKIRLRALALAEEREKQREVEARRVAELEEKLHPPTLWERVKLFFTRHKP